MKVLVACADYPNLKGGKALSFVHVRNKYYVKAGIETVVINFSAKEDYLVDNIRVISFKTYKQEKKNYDCLILHAPNIRNHFRFLIRFGKRFHRLVFIFHGHEILMINKEYPEPFYYKKRKSKFLLRFQDFYDRLKVSIWKKYFTLIIYKSEFVFVSEWLLNKFYQYVGIEKDKLNGHTHIIHNSVGQIFEENSYDYICDKKYDFITIRSNMDDSKYAIDIVNKLAIKNPQYSFLVVGKGDFFSYYKKADNITLIKKSLSHKEMLDYINMSKCGLLPTREDTQGVVACEMCSFGIPVITSNIDVCKEIFDRQENVVLISNNIKKVELGMCLTELWKSIPYEKNRTYFFKNTVEKEIALLKNINRK